MLLKFTNPYLNNFIKKYLPDPFENLLEDEEQFSSYKLNHPQEALQKAKEHIIRGKQKLTAYQRIIELEFETQSTETSQWAKNPPTKLTSPSLSGATQRKQTLFKGERNLYSQSLKLTAQVFKADPTGNTLSQDLKIQVSDLRELILIATGI